jgi:hypothetical protein
VLFSLKAINEELAKRSSDALLARGDGPSFFWGGEAVDWLDRTVRVTTLQSLTLEQWMERYRELKKKSRTAEREEQAFQERLTELALIPGISSSVSQ